MKTRGSRVLLLSAVTCHLLFACRQARAQAAYEIQVYDSETQEAGTTFAELHTNTATDGPKDGPGDLAPDRGAFHETLELTHGFSDWFETGFYVFTNAASGRGWDWVGDHLRPRVRVPESWGWPVGVSLSLEGGYLREGFANTRWDMEIRPIVDWRSGRFYAAVNPALERGLTFYSGGETGFVFAPDAKVSWDVTRVVTVGLEYYASLGRLTGFDPVRDQQHQLYPSLDLNLGPGWEFNAGPGFGLTPATDRLDLKLILGHRFG